MHKAMQARRGERGERGERRQEGQRKEKGARRKEANRGERRARLMERFDANQDGQLDEAERQALREAVAKMRAAREAKRGQSGDGINPEAKRERVRQGRGSADGAPSDLRPRRR